MLINLRNALMAGKRLPYDAEVEYLQSSGTQYIDTLVNADSNLSVEITMANAGTPWSNVSPNGAIRVTPRARHHLSFDGNIHYYFCTGNTSTSAYIKPSDGEVFTYKVDAIAKTLSVNSSTFSLPNDTFDSGMTYWFFGRNGTTPPYLGKLRIYSAKLWNGSVIVRDYIPVRKGTVGYLYDRVSGRLFGNAGAGEFQYGQDVVPVEYIESHGAEYIDTGYIPNQQTRWELDYQFSTIGSGSNGMFQENPTVRFNIGQGTDRFFNISYGANNALNIASDTLRHLFVADIPNLQWRLDSSSGAFPAPVSTALQYSLRIFCRNSPGGTVYNRHSGKCFASRMYQSDALSQRLLPVRVGTDATSWVGAMIDTLTRRIYRNQGTGAFAYGNDLKYPIPAS